MSATTCAIAMMAVLVMLCITIRMDLIIGVIRRNLIYRREATLNQFYRCWVKRVYTERTDKSVPLSRLLIACIGEDYCEYISVHDIGVGCSAWLDTLDDLSIFTIEDRMFIEKCMIKYLRSTGR